MTTAAVNTTQPAHDVLVDDEAWVKCDVKCPARSTVKVWFADATVLHFCGHHYRVNEDVLRRVVVDVLDASEWK